MSMRLIAGVAGVLCVVPAFAAWDNFNRADLGPTWTMEDGSVWIAGKKLHGDRLSMATFNKAKHDMTATVDVAAYGHGVTYGAITIGDVGKGRNAFIKIQTQNGEGTFDTAGFYTGNNSPVYFFRVDLPPTNKIRMTAAVDGSVATMTLSDADGNVLASYSYDYGESLKDGGIGLGTYGNVGLDKLRTSAGSGGAAPAAIPATLLAPAQDLSLMP
jgi:hypothetical protein